MRNQRSVRRGAVCIAATLAVSPMLTVALSSADASPTVNPMPHLLVYAAHWQPFKSGHRLVVTPSTYGRAHGAENHPALLKAALHAARPKPQPLTHTERASLRKQLRCHADTLPMKPRWSVETTRPDVSYAATKAAFCNPKRTAPTS